MAKYPLAKIDHLTPEQQIKLFESYKKLLEEHISSPRIEAIKLMLEDLETLFVMAPASPRGHGAYYGGLLEHLIDAIKFSLHIRSIYSKLNINDKTLPSKESCVLTAGMHDIGKLGSKKNPHYIVEDSDWHIKHMNRNFKFNDEEVAVMHHSDGSLYTLQAYGIELSKDEYLAIRIHDGPGAETNRWGPYMWGFEPLAHITVLADRMATVYREMCDIERKL